MGCRQQREGTPTMLKQLFTIIWELHILPFLQRIELQ